MSWRPRSQVLENERPPLGHHRLAYHDFKHPTVRCIKQIIIVQSGRPDPSERCRHVDLRRHVLQAFQAFTCCRCHPTTLVAWRIDIEREWGYMRRASCEYTTSDIVDKDVVCKSSGNRKSTWRTFGSCHRSPMSLPPTHLLVNPEIPIKYILVQSLVIYLLGGTKKICPLRHLGMF